MKTRLMRPHLEAKVKDLTAKNRSLKGHIEHLGKQAEALEEFRTGVVQQNLALGWQVRRFREALDNLRQAWAENFDCSANPGHEAMDMPMAWAIELLDRNPKQAEKIVAAYVALEKQARVNCAVLCHSPLRDLDAARKEGS